MDRMAIVSVTGPLAHDIVIGAGELTSLGPRVAALGASRVLLACDRTIAATHGDAAHASLRAAGVETARIELVADEREKGVAAVAAIWSAALAAKVTRRDAIVALGGGLVGDVVGFAAASYLRGVPLIQVPTTLLAMVDASTGGKTGINLALPDGSLGKNLAGAFWAPAFVLIDPDTLATLGDREFRSGLAECVKHGMLEGEEHFAFVEGALQRVLEREAAAIAEIVRRSVAVKAAIVSRDPYERGERATLNLGHTFAHAFETMDGADLLHGEAVAIGLVAACALADELRVGDRALGTRVRSVLERSGLPTRAPRTATVEAVRRRMAFDKKAGAGGARFVVPERTGAVRTGVEAQTADVLAALAAVGIES